MSYQRTLFFVSKQSAHTMRNSKPPLRGWICHSCSNFNAPGTLAAPEGRCRKCDSPVCEAECADATITTRDDRRCSGYACWYCKYFWAWIEGEDGDPLRNDAPYCGVCGDLEEEEVLYVKSWLEELDAVKEEVGEKQEELIEEKEDEKEDKEAKMNDLDDGRGAFIIVNRRRARPKKRAGGGNTAQWMTNSGQYKIRT